MAGSISPLYIADGAGHVEAVVTAGLDVAQRVARRLRLRRGTVRDEAGALWARVEDGVWIVTSKEGDDGRTV